MKKFLALFTVLTLAACSGDDDKNEITQNKFLSTVAITYNDYPDFYDVRSFYYDNKKHIKTVTKNDSIIAAFTYEGDNVVSIAYDEENVPLYHLTYNKGVLSGFSFVHDNHTITYNGQANTYTINNLGPVLHVSGKDFFKRVDFNGEVNTEVKFDSTKKGPLYNVPGDNLFVVTFFGELYPYVSAQAMISVTESTYAYTASNTYDDEGYVTRAVITSSGHEIATLNYTYKAL